MGWLWEYTAVMGVYSGWDCFLPKYGGEVFLERQSILCMSSY